MTREAVFLDLKPGLGEAPIVPYYPHTVAGVREYLEEIELLLGPASDEPPEHILARLPDGPPPARSALDSALHDRWAQMLGLPLGQALALESSPLPISSVSIGIPADDAALERALSGVRGWPILKIKLGTGDVARDIAIARTARRLIDARLIVDANGAWLDYEAVRAIHALGEIGIELIEEPITSQDPEVWQTIRRQLSRDAPLIAADESIQDAADVRRLAPLIDVINVKLAKAGGIGAARAIIAEAGKHGLKVLLGCMIETSLGITAAAQIASLADYADLDGHLHIENDPYEGAAIDGGRIILPTEAGLGCSPRLAPGLAPRA